jgi:hypothetical protein
MSKQNPGNLRTTLVLFGIVVATLIASLLAPAVYVPESHDYFKNDEMILSGWAALTYAVVYPAVFYLWMPNMALTIGMMLLLARRYRGAMAGGMAALGLAVANCLIVVTFFGDNFTGYCKPLVGYYLWMASMAALAVGSWYCARNHPSTSPVGRIRGFLIGAMLGMVGGIGVMLSLALAYVKMIDQDAARGDWYIATKSAWYLASTLSAVLGAIVGFVIGGIAGELISKRARG